MIGWDGDDMVFQSFHTHIELAECAAPNSPDDVIIGGKNPCCLPPLLPSLAQPTRGWLDPRYSHQSNMTSNTGRLPILALAIVGKKGQPLYIRNFTSSSGGEADLKWHYAAHVSLDIFDERGES